MAALLIPGLAFLSALVLVALANTANVHTKANTESQQTFWGFIGDALTGKTVVHQITQATRSAVSRWALAQLKPVTAWFVALTALLLNIFRTRAEVTEQTAGAFERLRHTTIPREAGKAAAPAKAAAKTATQAAHKAQAKATSTSTSLHNYRVRTAPRIAHATHAVDVTLPQQLGRIRTREGVITKDLGALKDRTKALEDGALDTWRWIRSHPLAGVTGVFAGAVAVALSRLGWGVLRCRSWQNLGRSLKCSDASLLADLLAAATLSVGLLSLVELAKEEQRVIREVADAVHFVLEA